jgi:hypothetical protein
MTEWVVKNFERGMSDNYIDGARNSGQRFDNVLISRNRKPFSRTGSEDFIPGGNSKIPNTTPQIENQRINHLADFNDDLFAVSANRIFYPNQSVTSFNELKSPADFFNSDTEYDAFPEGTATNAKTASAFWQNHLYMSNYENDGTNARSKVRKIYRDEDGNVQLRNAGLPAHSKVRLLKTAITLAVDIKAKFDTHFNDLSEHDQQQGFIGTPPPTPTDLPTLIAMTNYIKDGYVFHNEDIFPSKALFAHKANVSGADQNGILESSEDIATLTDAALMLNDIKNKYNNQHLNLSASHLNNPSTPSITAADATDIPEGLTFTGGGGENYLIGIVYKYEYRNEDTTYIDRSDPSIFAVNDATIASDITFLVDKLQQTTFGPEEAWDSKNITVEIYMTVDDGTVLQLRDVQRQDLDTTDQISIKINNTANLGINLYTTGDVLGNGEPPKAKFIVQANDVMWYLNVSNDELEEPSKFYHSLPLDPDAVPNTFFGELDEAITGGGKVGIFPIVFTSEKTYRLEGRVDSLGRGFVKKRLIDDTVGCISHNSIVEVKDGLYFAGPDGFYFTNGAKVVKISEHLTDSYKICLNQFAKASIDIHGTYNPEKNLVYWAMGDRDPDAIITEVNTLWVHDRQWGIPNNQGTFTLWRGVSDNFSPTAIVVINGELVRGDKDGYVFIHSDGLTEDPVIDVTTTSDNWDTITVIYDYVSSAFNFGSDFQRKYCTKLLTTLKANTAANVLPQSINDDSETRKDLRAIRNSVAWAWGDPFFVWGDPTFIWRTDPTLYSERRFPRDGLRCTLKQVAYTNDRAVLTNSDSVGSVSADTVTKVITIDTVGNEWGNVTGLSGLRSGLFIPGNDPGATDAGFLILSATSTTITVQDVTGRLIDSYSQWIIVNFDKDETFHLEGYTVIYENFGSSHTAFRPGDLGENQS